MEMRGAKIALIDIPIGLSDDANERACDKLARESIGPRRSSVFRVPCRQAMEAYKKGRGRDEKVEKGKIKSVKITGGCLSQQTWGIAHKIADVDDFWQSKKCEAFDLRESHPEVCFWALNNDTCLEFPKRKSKGAAERKKILKKHLCNSKEVVCSIRCEFEKSEVANDDILDALVLAVTAKLGYLTEYSTLPESPCKDSCGLPMEMVFYKCANSP